MFGRYDLTIYGIVFLNITEILLGQEVLELGNEYCQFEVFNPKCSSSEVIVIHKSLFGRMKKGKCVTEEEIKASGSFIHDPKYFGCSVDVTNILHERCSFKQQCSVKVSDSELKKVNPCLPGLNLHLEADFKCVEVFQTDFSNCYLAASSKPKYLMSESFKNKECGYTNNPWIIEVPKGQRLIAKIAENQIINCNHIEITLHDEFGRRNFSLCDESYQVESTAVKVIKSIGNIVKMYVRNMDIEVHKFLIKFQADGCLDIIPPEDTWLKRTIDDIVIGCYSSKQTWYLRCEHGKWTGSIGNCSQNKVNFHNQEDGSDVKIEKRNIMPKHQQILAIVSIFGVGVVICSLIICAGAVCAKRYSINKKGGKLKPSINAYEQTYNHRTYQNDFQDKSKSNCIEPPMETETMPDPLVKNDKTYFVLEDGKNFMGE